jgi:hypothetical protein
VLQVETVLALDSSDRRVHQVLDAFGLGGGRDGLALDDLVLIGRARWSSTLFSFCAG